MKIDFHAHILPEADHGSVSVKESLEQLALLKASGVTHVVATPHFYPHHSHLRAFIERRDRSAAALAAVLPPDAPTVYVGAEVTLCRGLERMEGVEQLAIRGTNVILIEMPAHAWDRGLYETLVALRDECGLHPVLAHLNRYPVRQGKTLIPYHFDIQLNADGVARLFHGPSRLCLHQGNVVALGTDIHGTSRKATRDFLKAEEKLGHRLPAIYEATTSLLEGAIPLHKENL